jgi:uncharacterized membrane protein YtjA (UPF0391 family)
VLPFVNPLAGYPKQQAPDSAPSRRGNQALTPSAERRLQQAAAARTKEEFPMLYWTFVFLMVAIVAAVFGFGGIVSAAAGIAKILFFIFLILFIVSLFTGRRGRI